MRTDAFRLPAFYNYFGLFLTMRCNFACSYCINGRDPRRRPEKRPEPSEWAEFLNRLDTGDVPITLQGGEPTMYPGFYDMVAALKPEKKLDLLTNLSFDIDEFIKHADREKFTRPAPYAPIRVSYHPEFMKIDETISRIRRLEDAGFRIGLYSVAHPDSTDHILEAKSKCLRAGVDFRVKPFLGIYNGTLYGRYKYLAEGAFSGVANGEVDCRTSDFLCGPDGGVYRCHHDLYSGGAAIADIKNPVPAFEDRYRKCDDFGLCEYCDLKVKNNRFQNYGHTTVDIVFTDGSGR